MSAEQIDRIEQVTSLKEFFRDSVHAAMDRQGLTATDHTAYYVVNLLTLFARSESLFDETDEGLELKPVAKVLADSLDAGRAAERDHALQRVGDVSLFLAGFWGDGLATRLVDIDYYVFMGGTAYGTLSINVRGSVRGRAFGSVFAELAEKFQDFVDVLADLKAHCAGSQSDVLRLYETWLRTGSQRAKRLLRSLGIDPLHSSSGATRH